jgi:DHA2 family methylenomycin A resistance protein-like MFS transporter
MVDGMTRRPASIPSSPTSVLLVMCVGYFLVLLDVTIVNVALPSIGGGLHAGTAGLQWVVDGYAVALASLMLAGGTIGDVRGHRPVVLTGLGVFGAASLGCGLASTPGLLVGARVVQGIGAALLLPGTLAVVGAAFPGRAAQARAIGIWAGVGSMALPAGPLLGGALVQALGWRAVFLVNVPIVALALVAVPRVVPRTRRPRAGAGARLDGVEPDGPRIDRPRLDLAGVLTGGLALATGTYAVIETGHVVNGPAGGSTPAVVAYVASGLFVVAFLLVERSRRDPMVPLELFRRPAFATANAVAGVMNLGTLGLLFVLTLYLQSVQGRSALAAGVALVPLFLPLTLLAPVGGRVTARIGPRWVMTAGLLTSAAGVALIAGLEPDSGYLDLLPALLGWGIGLGLLTPAAVAAAVGAVEPARSGLASGVNNTARQAGGAIGIAVCGAVVGSAADHPHFIHGLHLTALGVAGLYLAAALATITLVPAASSAP